VSYTLSERPLAYAEAGERVEYLKRVFAWTFGGLVVAGISAMSMAAFVYLTAAAGITIFLNQWVSLAIILGSYGIAQWVAPKMVFGEQKVLGFGIGAVFEGIAMGYLLLAAMTMGAAQGNPLGLVTLALMMTGLTGLGMTAYVWTSPREFSFIGAALSALSLPMLILMGVGLVFPALFGGVFGILISGLFVVISAAGLLYQVNQVFHKLDTRQHIEGAFLIMMGLLVLFWNILVLLMKLNRR
jgi:FtsH-binding integral membrane protein